MNINHYIKKIKDYALKSGVSDENELHEIATLSIYKMLQTPALKGYLKKHKLAYNAHENKTLLLVEDSFFGGSYSINDDNTINSISTFIDSNNALFVKNNELKKDEEKFFNVLSQSENFGSFSKKIIDFSKSVDLNEFKKQTNMDCILIKAFEFRTSIKDDNVGHMGIKVEPFAYLRSNYLDKRLIEFLPKTIDEKLEYLKDNDNLLKGLSTIDGLLFTNIDKFKEALKNNQLDEDSLLYKLLSSNEPVECIDAVFDGDWFETYKERTLKSLKRCIAMPTVDSLYNEYPIIDTILDSIYEEYPYFNISQNDMFQLKLVIENNETSYEDKVKNRKTYIDEMNQFSLDLLLHNDDIDEQNYSRLYGLTPFGVLIEIGGPHDYSENGYSIIAVDKMPMNSMVSEENERFFIEQFMNYCEKNKVICCYEGDMISSHVIDVFKEFKGKVVLIDRDNDTQETLAAYQVMISKMDLNYNQILQLEKEIPSFKDHLDEKEIIELLTSKLKQHNKLTL